MLQMSSAQKFRRLVTRCPDNMHREFLELSDRTGESASLILRGLINEALQRARRGEPVVRGLTAGAPTSVEG